VWFTLFLSREKLGEREYLLSRGKHLKVLVLHNSYQHAGGEDAAVVAESAILTAHGHQVIFYRRSNNEIAGRCFLIGAATAIGTTWSSRTHGELAHLLQEGKPDVAHFHNTFPLISPSAYYACAEGGVPVVQTLHNYRLLCPGATFLRDGKVCEECLGRAVPWPGVLHGCYRGSRPATLATAAMLSVHRTLGTWQNKVNLYIALTEFARKQFIAGGLPAERIVVKSNFVAERPLRQGSGGDYGLWVGRLSEEKGIRVLVAALGRLSPPVPFKLAGDGPLLEETASEIGQRGLKQVDLLGAVSPHEVIRLMHGARFVVVPSVCFENFPLVIAESFACGVPVVASRIGSLAEIVQDGVTGLHFESGNATDLAAKVLWAWEHPEEMDQMGHASRDEYEAKYTVEQNYQALMRIYASAGAMEAST
jgi:glycosyltransferase involved in cell wall biosynthesis